MTETPLAARAIPVTAPETRRSWHRKILPSLGIGVLLGLIALFEGAPLFAAGIAVVAMTSLGAAVQASLDARSAPATFRRLGDLVRPLRDLTKATQFMLVAFFVTSVFALELQFDVVPNRYGFIALILPVAIAAILFDILGGLFCAALTIAYTFQALAPPRFAPILETDLPWQMSLITFAAAAICTAFFFASEAQPLFPARPGQLQIALRASRHWRHDLLAGLSRVPARLKTHVLPGAALVLLYALFWSTFASLSSFRGLHGDSLEAYSWGREFVFGYYKHPPFWSWVAGAWFSIMPRSNFSFLLLSELNGALGLAGAWALIGRFGNRRLQMLGVLLLMLTPFYQFNAQRFNANTILLSIWPWTLYFFVRSVETRMVRHAAICGLLAGFAILSKYFGAILIATCFFAALTHDSRRRYFTSAAPYVSTAVAVLVFLPHLAWLFRDGFQPFIYLSNRIDLADRAISNQYFGFITGNLAFFVLPSAVLLLARWRKGTEPAPPKIAGHHGISFFNVLAFAPFVLTLVAGTVGHAALGIPFAVPIFALIPLALIHHVMPNIEAALRTTRFCVGALVVGCLVVAPALPYFNLRLSKKHYSEPRQEIADLAIDLWHAQTGVPLRFVAGDRDFQLATVFLSRDNTSEFNNFNFRWSPWVTPEGLARHGLMAICRTDQESCNERATLHMREGAKMTPISYQREVWGEKGDVWTVNVYIIPPVAAH